MHLGLHLGSHLRPVLGARLDRLRDGLLVFFVCVVLLCVAAAVYLLLPSERGPSAPVPSIVYENWAGVDIMYYLDGRWRRQSLVYFGKP